jgi:hypothetical protein
MMVLAVLAYPGTDSRSHRQRNQFINSIIEFMKGATARTAGRSRIPRGSAFVHGRKDRLFATLDRGDRRIQIRLEMARIAYELRGRAVARMFNDSKIKMKVGDSQPLTLRLVVSGPKKISEAINALEGRETRTLWRRWQQSLPVLHLALALREKGDFDDRDPGTLWRVYLRRWEKWLGPVIENAHFQAMELHTSLAGYELGERIELTLQTG